MTYLPPTAESIMNSIAELRKREEALMRKEEELNKELCLWEKRCLSVEKTAAEVKEKVKKMEEENSLSEENKNEESQSIKGIISALHDDIQNVNMGFTGLGLKSTEMFSSIKQEYADLRFRHEQLRQYSMLNNALIHGFTRLPNLKGTAFIFSITEKLNQLFPSLPYPILPSHIDDAHPLRTRNRNSRKVVIIRFANRWVKDILMDCQWDLRGTGLRLTEHLTDCTRDLQSQAAKIVGYYNATVVKTKVYAKHNGMNFNIRCQKDIDDLRNRVNMHPPTVNENVNSLSSNNHITPPFGRGRDLPNNRGRYPNH